MTYPGIGQILPSSTTFHQQRIFRALDKVHLYQFHLLRQKRTTSKCHNIMQKPRVPLRSTFLDMPGIWGPASGRANIVYLLSSGAVGIACIRVSKICWWHVFLRVDFILCPVWRLDVYGERFYITTSTLSTFQGRLLKYVYRIIYTFVSDVFRHVSGVCSELIGL